MGYGSGLAAGAAALWLATVAWPQAALAQGTPSFEPLKAAGGRFEIIAGGNAAQHRSTTPPPLAIPRAAEAQPVQRPVAAPRAAATSSVPAPVAAAMQAQPAPRPVQTPAEAVPSQPLPAASASAATDSPSTTVQTSAAVPDDLAPIVTAAATQVDPMMTGAVPRQPAQPRVSLPTVDENVKVAISGDALMTEALRRARNSLEDFLKSAIAPPEGASGFAVKVLVGPKEAREALWVSALERRVQRNLIFGTSERWSGRLANAPTENASLQVGDRISFETSEIRDWTYFSADGRPQGNFTACALTAPEGRAKLAELTEKTGLDCGWTAKVARTASR